MTPFFKLFLMLSITLFGAMNVADAFMVESREEPASLLELTQ